MLNIFEDMIKKRVKFPMILTIGNENIALNNINPESSDYRSLLDLVKKNKELKLSFFSSQPPFVFERVHDFCDTYIPNLSQKIDTLLREITKNGEKENITFISKKVGLIDLKEECAPLSMMRLVLNEVYFLEGEHVPLLYKFPDIYMSVNINVRDNELYIGIENYGTIQKQTQFMIQKRIEIGQSLAQFDLRQEFEMKKFNDCSDIIRSFYLFDYPADLLDNKWESATNENFRDYWNNSNYFKYIGAGIHTSFYPYFAIAYEQLREDMKKRLHPSEKSFSAGMGYIQCAFIIEANRNLYGTYGKIFTPRNQDDNTMAGFKIGFPDINIDI
jgi:hypothetical protein